MAVGLLATRVTRVTKNSTHHTYVMNVHFGERNHPVIVKLQNWADDSSYHGRTNPPIVLKLTVRKLFATDIEKYLKKQNILIVDADKF